MYQLKTKKGKIFWLSKAEVIGIRKLLQQGTPFITLERYDKTLNVFEIEDVGIPDFALPMIRKGFKIEFDGDTPVIQKAVYELRYEEGKWVRYEGIADKEYVSFDTYVGNIKRLN